MNKTRHNGTSNTVYEKLREKILHLELPPGSAISEIDTAEQYEISRTPVRDAFKMLEREGLLEIRPHIGTFVSLIDLDMISDILYVRETLEQAVLRDLALSCDRSQEFRVRLVLREQAALLEAGLPPEELGRAFILSDNEFHRTLYELAGKENVMSFLTGFNAQYERFRTFLNLGGHAFLQKLQSDHTAIWEHIAAGEPEPLSRAISCHIYDGFNNSTEIVAEHPEYFKAHP